MGLSAGRTNTNVLKITEKAYPIFVLHLQLVIDFILFGKDRCVTDQFTDLGLVGRKGTGRDVIIL